MSYFSQSISTIVWEIIPKTTIPWLSVSSTHPLGPLVKFSKVPSSSAANKPGENSTMQRWESFRQPWCGKGQVLLWGFPTLNWGRATGWFCYSIHQCSIVCCNEVGSFCALLVSPLCKGISPFCVALAPWQGVSLQNPPMVRGLAPVGGTTPEVAGKPPSARKWK